MNDTVTKANRDINSLQPVAQKAARLFLDECKKRGIDIFVTEYHRSQVRQDYLYCQGRTVSECVKAGIPKSFAEKYCRAGKQVTWTRNSNHTAGYAWDIAVSPPHTLYDASIIAKAGQVAKELGIEWGGDWKQKDTPHFQVDKDWKEPVIKEDEELKKAVTKIIDSGIKINDASWNRLDRINIKNVPALLNKLGGIDSLVEGKVISNDGVWRSGNYTKENARSLLIKYASKLG